VLLELERHRDDAASKEELVGNVWLLACETRLLKFEIIVPLGVHD
jgi:hypothetical protein